MKRTTIFKSLLIAVAMLTGSNAWAAGYTRTLTDELKVAGYKAKAFYDFQKNSPEVLPTSGDLRYRDGNVWGLHNFGSGTRSATATIPVAEGDIIVLQHYSDVISTINRGTLNSNLSSSAGYQVYDITTTADDITFTIARYGGIIAAFVMEEDASVSTADYTINYKVNGEGDNVKTSTGTLAVGGTVNAETSFFVDGVKYVLNGEQTTTMTITDGTNVLNINVKEADTYSYTVNAIISVDDETTILKQLATGSVYADESVTVPYPAYILSSGTLYSCGVTNNEYRKSFTITENEQVSTITYTTDAITNAVFYSEGEELDGATVNTTGTNVAVRASNAAAASIEAPITICELPAGNYTIKLGGHHTKNNAEVTTNFTYGKNTISLYATGTNRVVTTSDEFAISETTDLVLSSITGDGLIDYIIIQKTGDYTTVSATIGSTGFATYSNADFALDFTGLDVKAYTASLTEENTVLLTPIEKVPAGTGVMLKGKGSYDIPVIASATFSGTNLFVASTGEDVAASVEGKYHYALANGNNGVGFYNMESARTIAAGKAYIESATPLADAQESRVNWIFADEGIVNAIEKINVESAGNEVYNLNGQRVAAPQKGLYIVNGKKVVVK